ncbi:MAG TPA: hypothetical protein VK279_11075 [Solirubrobacteraceae bacterium]|nr:hypothetical protein [Solirubrobacteraceae bacterium]
MEGGIAILLLLFIIGAGAVLAFWLFGASGLAKKHEADEGGGGERPPLKVPNPEQQAREKGRLYPSSRDH